MKIMAVNGSGRGRKGNTQLALGVLAETLAAAGVATEIEVLAEQDLRPCLACYACRTLKRCCQKDAANPLYERLAAADGLVLASPVHFSNVTSRMAMFIERVGFIARMSGENSLKGKPGAAIAVCRRAGANTTFAAMNYFFGIQQMPVISSSYWNVIYGREPGEVMKDEEGLATIRTLAQNMAHWLRAES